MAVATITKRASKHLKAKQLSLFPEIICSAYLVATESPRVAFYRIWIEVQDGIYSVRKESGTRNKVLDKRAWQFDSFNDALKLFDRRVKSKANPNRNSPRKYTLVYNI